MELDDLRTFVAVAEVGSVSRAAQELYLTQPAVTRRLQRFESALGAGLLDRRRRPFALTPAGAAALERCRRVLSSLRELEASGPPGAMAGDLRIGVAHALTEWALAEPVDRVRRVYPGVRLHVVTGWSRPLLEQVRAHALDAGVILLPIGEDLPAGIDGASLGRERLVVVAARKLARRVRGPGDLKDVSWVLNPEGCAARAALRRALHREGFSMPVGAETYTYELQLALVARQRGLGFVPSRILARSKFRSRLSALRWPGFEFPLSIWSVRGQASGVVEPVLRELNQELAKRLAATRRHPRELPRRTSPRGA